MDNGLLRPIQKKGKISNQETVSSSVENDGAALDLLASNDKNCSLGKPDNNFPTTDSFDNFLGVYLKRYLEGSNPGSSNGNQFGKQSMFMDSFLFRLMPTGIVRAAYQVVQGYIEEVG